MGKTDARIYEIKVCLKILGFDGPPNVISKILGMAPTRVWQKGDKVPKTVLEYEQNGWLLRRQSMSSVPIPSALLLLY